MKKILFKSEELTIVIDSESKVLYGNTTKKSAVDYLTNLTPKNGEEAMGIIGLIILIVGGKYVVAKEIKATTVVTVKTAKPSMVKLLKMHFVLPLSLDLRQKCRKSLIKVLHHWKLFVSGTFYDCFSPFES